jgi:hypothetical protein
MRNPTPPWPEITFPPEETEALREAYAAARVILEYGSGGSTVLAASLPGKRVFSVESDADWALRLQTRLDGDDLPSAATVHHVDIGPTGAWGRPTGPDAWERFWRYPASVWDASWFRHPDVVLIDGRLRTACFMTVLFRITRPVTILFDDYVTRPDYHGVADFRAPSQSIGRMALFHARPGLVDGANLSQFMDLFNRATYAGTARSDYDSRSAPPALSTKDAAP